MTLNRSGHKATLYLNDQDTGDARKLYRWMEEGLEIAEVENVREVRFRWLGKHEGAYCACAIGFALIGKYGSHEAAMIAVGPMPRAQQCAVALGISEQLVEKISETHVHGMPARTICEALRTQVEVLEVCSSVGVTLFPARREELVSSLVWGLQ